ncbi:MAG: GntR family transcriptional regulator [Actinobacteria bacterium]|nr:GntR family transcriptional regulator [Actinomycetota bacterium]
MPIPRRQPVHALHLGGADRRRDEARRLRDVFNSGLERGRLWPERLPDELDMAAAHGASRNAVREAFGLLVAEGRVERQVGAGSFSRRVPARYPFDRIVEGTTIQDELHDRRRSKLLGFRVLDEVPDGLRSTLGFAVACRRLAVFERISGIDGMPTELRTYLLAVPDGVEVDRAACVADVYGYIEDAFGRHIAGGTRAVSAMVADESTALHLNVPPGSALLFMESRLEDENGDVVLITFGRHRNDHLTVTFRTVRPAGVRRAASA